MSDRVSKAQFINGGGKWGVATVEKLVPYDDDDDDNVDDAMKLLYRNVTLFRSRKNGRFD